MTFTVTAHHSEFLPVGDATVDIVATVRAGVDAAAPRRELAEVILLDCSGSMGAPQAKMRAAQVATVAAIDVLPDGTRFAVVGGSHVADMIYPGEQRLAVADESTRAAARLAVRRVTPHGGTAIGAWLRLARTLMVDRPDAIGHAILLTDGRNESEPAEVLRTAVEECAGVFTVDCRAIGSAGGSHDWDGPELLAIAEALGANPVVPVEDVAVLADEFTAVLRHAMASRDADVRLRVRHTGLARVAFVKQVHPVIADLTGRGVPLDAHHTDYPTGAWSPGDRRDFHVALEVDPMAPGVRRRVAWLSVRTSTCGEPGSDGPEPDEAGITMEWTDDVHLFTAVHPTVAHYTSQQDLADAIRQGSAALVAGDRDAALRHFGQAVALAHAAGAGDKLSLLARVVDVDDAATGWVRLRPDVDPLRLPPLTASGPQTSSWRGAGPPAPPPPAAVPAWEHCGTPLTTRFCGTCGARHDTAA